MPTFARIGGPEVPLLSVATAHIRLLGAFEVLIDGRTIDDSGWPSKRAAELVQLLALTDNHRLLRDQVIDALWPHLDAEAGAANLRKAAHHARRAVGDPDSITLNRGQVSLFPDRQITTDASQFKAAADLALARGDAEAARRALNDYPGELLPASLYDDWAESARFAIQDLRSDLRRLGGRWDQLMDLDPTDEEAARELMREALSTGRRHIAISCYGRLRTALRRELGVRPSAETEAVYDDCVRGLIAAESNLVGRELELSIIGSRLRGAANGAAVIALRGPAGIGKSSLCREAVSIATAEGWQPVTVTAGLTEGPYATLTEVVEYIVTAHPGALDGAGQRARSVLAELAPMIESTAPLQIPVTRHQVIGAVRRLLVAASSGQGTLLVIDDAHSADAATIEAILHLAAVAAAPILTVLAYRPEAAPETLRSGVARLSRAGSATTLDLAPLEQADARALAADTGLDSDETVTEIVDLAQGNPFFVLELAKSALDGGRLRIGLRQDAIATRFADLDDGDAAMLRRLALAGNDLDLMSVMALTGSGDDESSTMLDAALSSGILVVAEGRYRFAHELVRQAMIDEIAPHHRVAIHRDAARRLTDMNGAPAHIARHWREGNRPDLAEPWLLSAAQRSVELAAFRDALMYLDPLLAHRPTHPDALLLRAESLEALGDSEALSAYAAAARASGEPAAQEIVPRQALAQIKQGDPEGALRTLSGAQPVTVEGQLAQALTLAGAAALGYGDPEIGAAKAAESRRIALKTGDSATLVIASWANAAAAHARGDLRDSVRIDLEETQNLPHLAVNVFDGQLCMTQRLLYGARPYADVISFAESLGSEAHRLGAARGYAFARTLGGEAKLLAGRLDDAEQDLKSGQELHHAMTASTGEAFSIQRRADVAIYRGQWKEAQSLLDDALAIAQESDVGFHLFDRIYGARIMAADGPEASLAALEDAEAAVLGPDETCPGCRITAAVPSAIAAAQAGDLERAAKYEEATVFLAEVVMRLPAWYAALHEVRGHIAAAEGDRESSSTHFFNAAHDFHAAGQPLDELRCRELANN